jgi:hypothetical protein
MTGSVAQMIEHQVHSPESNCSTTKKKKKEKKEKENKDVMWLQLKGSACMRPWVQSLVPNK